MPWLGAASTHTRRTRRGFVRCCISQGMTRSKRPPDFERSLTELETLVERLEGGELPLEESLKAFERGVALTRECQVALEAAQARVDILLKRDGEVLARPFDDEAEGEPELDGDHSPA